MKYFWQNQIKWDCDTSERAARRRIRLDRDLDPGKLTVPDISLMGCNTISSGAVEGFSAVATEAEMVREFLRRFWLDGRAIFIIGFSNFDPKDKKDNGDGDDLGEGLWVLERLEVKLAMLLMWIDILPFCVLHTRGNSRGELN